MRHLLWVIKVIVFLFLLLMALKNLQPVDLRFFLGKSWSAPLAVLLLIFFAAGALFGLFAGLQLAIRERKKLLQLRRGLRQLRDEQHAIPESLADDR